MVKWPEARIILKLATGQNILHHLCVFLIISADCLYRQFHADNLRVRKTRYKKGYKVSVLAEGVEGDHTNGPHCNLKHFIYTTMFHFSRYIINVVLVLHLPEEMSPCFLQYVQEVV